MSGTSGDRSRRLFDRHLVVLVHLALGSSFALAQEPHAVVLEGTVVTPDEVIENGFVSVVGNKLAAVGSSAKARQQRKVIETESFILPGLIDIHDHITWNLFPRWKPNHQFPNRYQWQAEPAYLIALDTPHRKLFEAGLGCEANFYGEVKALVNGATSVVGSLAPKKTDDNWCIAGNARNLDFSSGLYAAGGLNHEKLRNEVFPLEIASEEAVKIRQDLKSGELNALLVHLAEGRRDDASSAREFKMLERRGLLQSGVSIIHGLALEKEQFRAMAQNGVGLIWSPRSNIELYGSTTDVLSAKQAGVRIALAPDWSPSGSDGLLEELEYAATWNAGQNPAVFDDAELLRMTTIIPAQLAHLDDKIGSLKPTLYADLLLVRKNGDSPYHALTHSGPGDVRLVVVDGVPLYGDLDLMERLVSRGEIERIKVCGREKALHVQFEKSPSKRVIAPWKEISTALARALNQWGTSLADLAVCEGANQK